MKQVPKVGTYVEFSGNPKEKRMTDKTKTPAAIQAEKAIAEYREQIRRIYGSKIARNTVLHYADGWVWYKIAQKYPDGSVGVAPPYDAVRTKMLIQMTENLKKRK